MIPLPSKHVVILDIETTEVALANARGSFPEPVEIAGLLVNYEYTVLKEFQTFIRPTRIDEFTEFSSNFTGIRVSQIQEAPEWQDVWKDWADFTKGTWGYPLMSWGAPFDYGVLKAAYARNGTPWPHRYPFLDALSFTYGKAAEYGFKVKNWKLSSCCERFGIEPEKDHRAMTGARACLGVLENLSLL